MRRLIPALIVLLAAGPAFAARPPDALRAEVDKTYAAEMDAEADEGAPQGMISAPDAMFRKVDIDGDGVTDWRVDFGKGANASMFCGTGGCQQRLYRGLPDGGFELVLDTNVRFFKLGKVKGEHVLDLDFHGTACNLAGAAACPRRYAWVPALGRYIERTARDGSGWLSAGPTPLVAADPAVFPEAVREQGRRREALCADAGGAYTAGDLAANDLPDLNGDGVRDWVVTPYYGYCDMGEAGGQSPDIPTTILVSRPGGGFVVGFEAVEPFWGVQLGEPNRLVTLEGGYCGGEPTECRRVEWRWTGERFERP